MEQKPWSLARRLTRRLVLTTALIVATISAVASWYVHASTENVLAALAQEELEEMDLGFSTTAGRPGDFARLAAEFAEKHPEYPLAWRVWHADDGRRWGQFGRLDLFERAEPELEPVQDVTRFDGTLRWSTHVLGSDLEMGVLVDGSSQLSVNSAFDLLIVAFLVVSLTVLAVGAHLFGNQIASQLKLVADRARHVRDTKDEVDVDVGSAPEEIREVADALQEMLRNIRSESEHAQLIVSGLAHELRSPIQNLMGESEVALLRDRPSEEYRRVLRSQHDELRALARVVDNLVTLLASGEAGSQGDERFDLVAEARLRLEREISRAERRGVSIQLEGDESVHCSGDREAILLALSNMVSNAVEWAAQDGQVRVHIHANADHVELAVEDDGPGVPAEEHERVFQPFQVGHRNNGRMGFGLGLALTRTAVERHGGTIRLVDSSLGGARFEVSLPIRAQG